MKKVFGLLLCLAVVPMLFAGNDTDLQTPLKASGSGVHNVPAVDVTPYVQPSSRSLLYEQIGDTMAGNAYACQNDTVYPFEADLVDDVEPTANWNVDTVEMWIGHWGAWSSWNLVPHVNFLVYPDNGTVRPVDSPTVELIVEQGTYTATPAGAYEKVLMPLPSTVNLSSGTRYWLECQPWFSFAANGQTGNQASSAGFGNGQQFYYRFPILGVPQWQTSTAGGWGPLECYFRLYGTTGSVPTHDVGCTDISAPPAVVDPNAAYNPVATYHNFGTSSETFDAYFDIDSSGTNVYTQSYSVTLASGGDTTITFPSWTTGPIDGLTYDCIAYTVLGGDENPANDTTTQQCVTQSKYWKVYASNLPAATYYHAVATLDVSGQPKVFSFGGYNCMNSIFEFDCATETWSTNSATLPTGVMRTAAAAVGGNVYIAAGCDASYTSLNVMQEFDPVAGTVTGVSNVPANTAFNGAVAWRDTLVYVLGGQSGSTYYNNVWIYDPATDSWATGTPMPSTNRSFSCGIFEDNIYVAGGYNGAYISGAWVGAIDPANPTTITWTALPDIPLGASGTPGRSRVQGATDAWGHYYFVGGDDHGVTAVDCHYYDPDDGAWHADLPKPTPMTNTQAACFVNDLDGGVFFCAGGYPQTNATEGLVNLGQYGIAEIPGKVDLNTVGFAAMTNPVKGIADIVFTITAQSQVTLKVFDRTGRLVEQLVDRPLPAGVCSVSWNTANVPNGVYFLTLNADGQSDTHKMVVVR